MIHSWYIKGNFLALHLQFFLLHLSFLSQKKKAFSGATLEQVNKGIATDENTRAGKERSMVIKFDDQHKSHKSKFGDRIQLENFFSGTRWNTILKSKSTSSRIKSEYEIKWDANIHHADSVFVKSIFLIKNDGCLNNYLCFCIDSLNIKKHWKYSWLVLTVPLRFKLYLAFLFDNLCFLLMVVERWLHNSMGRKHIFHFNLNVGIWT